MSEVKHYKLAEQIGAGGMGLVYKAYDTILERDVAIKFMHKHLISDPQNEERFIREARAAAKLVHPNIVTIHEIGQFSDDRFIVMEYVQGISLTQKLAKQGPMPWQQACSYIIQLLSGLKSAHAIQMLHRDIKSDNLIITADNVVKILDFGIAKLTSQAGMTIAGDILGTVEYMPPEQMLGEDVDHRCDLYAAGTVMYQMLTGSLPFSGDIPVTVLYKKLNEDPIPPSGLNSSVPPEVDQIVQKAIEKDRDQRWQTAAAFIEQINKLLQTPGESATSTTISDLSLDFDFNQDENMVAVLPETEEIFIGRDEEFQFIQDLLGNIQKSSGKTLFIKGEAGVGKSALIQHFSKYARSKNAWVLYGNCLYQEGMDSYLPFIDALRGFLNAESSLITPTESLKIKEIIREKLPILSEFTQRFITLFGSPNLEISNISTTNAINLFEGIYLLLSVLSKNHSLILVIDDLQWADESSLKLFHYLAQHLTKQKVMLVGVCRTDKQDTQPQTYQDVILRLRQEGLSKELTLQRMSIEESTKLIDFKLKDQVLFTDEFYEWIFEETKGNPFFIDETLEILKEKSVIFKRDDAWIDDPEFRKQGLPRRIEDIFSRRLSALNDEDREILQIAAIIGQRFDITVLSHLLEISKIKLLKTFQRIEREMQVISSTDDGFKFDQPMLRELLYSEVPVALRKEYHLLIAEEFSEIYDTGSGSHLGEIAEHWFRGNNYKKAIPLLYQNADKSFKSSAFNEASQYYENILTALEKDGTVLPENIMLDKIHLNLGICLEEVGRWDESIETFDNLYALSRETGAGEAQVDAKRRIGRIFIKLGKWEAAERCFNECLELIETFKIENMLSRIYNNLGVIRFQIGEYDSALEYFDLTIQHAVDKNCDHDIAHAYTNIGIINNIKGRHNDAMKSYHRALEIYKAKENRQNEAQIYHNLGMTYSDMEQSEKAIEVFNQCLELANEIQDKQLKSLTNLNLGKLYLRMNNKEESKKHTDISLKFFKRVHDLLSVAEAYFIYGELYKDSAEHDKARKFYLESIKINEDKEYFDGLAEVSEAYAAFCISVEDNEEAIKYYTKALDAYKKLELPEKIASITSIIDKLTLSINQKDCINA